MNGETGPEPLPPIRPLPDLKAHQDPDPNAAIAHSTTIGTAFAFTDSHPICTDRGNVIAAYYTIHPRSRVPRLGPAASKSASARPSRFQASKEDTPSLLPEVRFDKVMDFRPSAMGELTNDDLAAFLSVGFTHHSLIVEKVKPVDERVLSKALVANIEKTIQALGGSDFCFMGREQSKTALETLAETAVASLLQRIRTPNLHPRAILLDAPLVIRASTANSGGPKD